MQPSYQTLDVVDDTVPQRVEQKRSLSVGARACFLLTVVSMIGLGIQQLGVLFPQNRVEAQFFTFSPPPVVNMDVRQPTAIVRQAPAQEQKNIISENSLTIADAGAPALFGQAQQAEPVIEVSYGRFMDKIDTYKQVIFSSDGKKAIGIDADGKRLSTSPLVDPTGLVQKLTDMNVDVVIEPLNNSNMPAANYALGAATFILPPLLIGYFLFGRNNNQGQQGGDGPGSRGGPRGGGGEGGPMNIFNVGQSNAKFQMEPDTGIKFADVAGCDEAKAELVEVVDFLKNPDRYAKLGAKIPRGVVLEGPPGTGKTLLARAVAGEAGTPFFATSGSEFVEMFVGVGASRVRDLFTNAKKNAPCIVFIDEIDAIGRARSSGGMGGNDEQENTLNQILTEMDGFDGASGVIVMAATNRADILDSALLRPGRFDRRTTVGLPDLQGRIEILKVHSKGKPLASDVDLKSVAKKSMGFSGASLQNLMNEGAIYAARRGASEIMSKDIDDALDRILVGLEKKGAVQTEKTKKTVAFHEAGHALLGALVSDFDLVQKITIIPRSNGAGGLTFFSPSEERLQSGLYTREYLECQLAVALGGRLAEELKFGKQKMTTGASNDIQQVARIARSMVTEWGMSDVVGPIAVMSTGGIRSQGPTYSKQTLSKVDKEVLRLVNNAYALGKKLLEDNMPILDDIADALLQNESVDGVSFQAILDKYNVKPKALKDMPMEDLIAAGYIAKPIEDGNAGLPSDVSTLVDSTTSTASSPVPEATPPSQFKRILEGAGLDETNSI